MMQRSVLGLAVLLLCSAAAFSQQTPRPTALREIIPGHYVFSSGTLNSGIIATSEGVVVLDALNSESVGKAEREAIAASIRQPVRFLVSSTFHNNYSKGKAGIRGCLADRARRLPHRSSGADAARQGVGGGAVYQTPNETYRDRVTLHLGGKEIRIRYLGRGHTTARASSMSRKIASSI